MLGRRAEYGRSGRGGLSCPVVVIARRTTPRASSTILQPDHAHTGALVQAYIHPAAGGEGHLSAGRWTSPPGPNDSNQLLAMVEAESEILEQVGHEDKIKWGRAARGHW